MTPQGRPGQLRFDGKVAIVTGAGSGLGRSHALLLARRGARVLVNDLGGGTSGDGKSAAPADTVVEEIRSQGGEARASYDSVEDGQRIAQAALDHFGRIDIVVNNAGILRDKAFHKMADEDWDALYRVHLLGSYRVTRAAWPHLREQRYGRVVFTASGAGIYGNFGQANYGAMKLGVVGLANVLAREGKDHGVRVNVIAPVAATRLTAPLMPEKMAEALRPELVSPLVAQLCHESCEESGGLFEVAGGFIAKIRWERASGARLDPRRPLEPEDVAAAWSKITSFAESTHPADGVDAMKPVLENLGLGP
jgi:NAD(P)-dependent dehydrogenase (short-subunit alcohol dehydrogenase family)